MNFVKRPKAICQFATFSAAANSARSQEATKEMQHVMSVGETAIRSAGCLP